MNLHGISDNQIVKFEISIQDSEQEIKESNNILKEKCGEINITNYGIFEIKCLLCGKYFANVRNYAKHVLQHHFQCNNDSTIASFVQVSYQSVSDVTETESQVLQNRNSILDEQLSYLSFNVQNNLTNNKKDDMIVKENQENSNSEDTEFEKENQENSNLEDTEFEASESTNCEEGNGFSCGFEDFPLGEYKNDQGVEKKESLSNLSNSESSEKENNENFDQNGLECKNEVREASLRDSTFKNLKFRKANSVIASNEKPVCKICGKQTAKYKMRQHLRSHDNSRYIHQCKICLKLFISEKSLNFHIKNLHTEEKPFVCVINNCGKKYVNENALNTHIKRHGGRPFSCDICGRGFLYQSRLNEHVAQHIIKLRKETGLETSLNPSEDNLHCSFEAKFDPAKRKKFKQKQIIKAQRKPRKVIPTSKPSERIICDICGKETPKTNMKQHLRSHDSSRYTHKCETCEKLFISQKSLDLHIKNLHFKNKPFTCSFKHCEKRFVNEVALKSHAIRHTSPREYKCETCNKAFIYQYRLEEHIKMYHVNGRMFRCETCEKRFFDKHTLERHQIVHSREKPFKCDECPAKFSRERSLQWHKKSHTGIKDYVCKICGKKYALYNGIYSHMKVHGIKYSTAYEKGLTDGKIENNEQTT